MIVPVDQSNIQDAAAIHSVSWQESHRSFCTPDFIALHDCCRQEEYLREKMKAGTQIYMLIDQQPVGIVSLTGNLIEDLYILPDMQNRGYGTELLHFIIHQCTGKPTLWILENNKGAERLYKRNGFKPTGKRNIITNKLDEIEYILE